MKPLMNEKETAALLCISPATLRRWRVEGKGPPFRKIGKSVRYSAYDVIDYIDARLSNSTSEVRGDAR